MDDETMGLVIAVAIGLAIVVALFLFIIPEPGETAVIATERLDVAVLSFSNSSAWSGAGETVRTRIETRLVNAEGITVFSRVRLDALLTEQALGQAGLLDPATAARIGSLTGVSKLVTGSVYGVETRSEAVTICEEWKGGTCTRSVPGTRYTVRVLAQVEVLNAQTGRIEQAHDEEGTASATVKQGEAFAGYEGLIASSADEIASDVASFLTMTYTREVRYGLYTGYTTKRDGYIGEGETTRFHRSDGEAYLVVHFTRVRDEEPFSLSWVDSGGNAVGTEEDVVTSGDWRLYRLDLASLPLGRFTVRGTLGGVEAFAKAFVLGS